MDEDRCGADEARRHGGLTGEEPDFILNYDIEYRLGRGTEDEE
jgi:hypothetical protein